MATSVRRTGLALRRASLPVRRKGPSPKMQKLQARVSSLSKRVREGASGHEHAMFAVGAAGLFSLAEKKTTMPTVMGLDPALLFGAALYLGGPKVLKGSSGKKLEAAGEGLLALGAARSVARGGVRVAGDDEYALAGDDDDD